MCRKNIDKPQIAVSSSLSIFQIALIVSEILKVYPVIVVPLLPLDRPGSISTVAQERALVTWPQS